MTLLRARAFPNPKPPKPIRWCTGGACDSTCDAALRRLVVPWLKAGSGLSVPYWGSPHQSALGTGLSGLRLEVLASMHLDVQILSVRRPALGSSV